MNKKRLIRGTLKRVDKAGLLKHFNFSTHTVINNKKFVVPIINGIGYQLLNDHEKWSDNIYKKLLDIQDGTFVDVGANNGQTLLKIAAQRPSLALSYIGFEPNPTCFYYLNRLALLNKFIGYDLLPVGLHYENKIVTLISDNDFAAGASIIMKLRNKIDQYKIRQHVPVLRGDEVIAGLPETPIAVIKADVEGAELEVIKGLTQTIAKHNPFIVLEILPVYDTVSENGIFRKQRQDEVLGILHGLDYIICRIDEVTEELIMMDDIEVHDDMSKTNYLFIPKSKLGLAKGHFVIK